MPCHLVSTGAQLVHEPRRLPVVLGELSTRSRGARRASRRPTSSRKWLEPPVRRLSAVNLAPPA
jgi:hypothetical protein